MGGSKVGLALRNRLGEEGMRDLDEYMDQRLDAGRAEMVNAVTDRLDTRFSALDYRFKECAKRDDMVEGFARITNQMLEQKAEILRWNFVFWLGELSAIGLLLTFILNG